MIPVCFLYLFSLLSLSSPFTQFSGHYSHSNSEVFSNSFQFQVCTVATSSFQMSIFPKRHCWNVQCLGCAWSVWSHRQLRREDWPCPQNTLEKKHSQTQQEWEMAHGEQRAKAFLLFGAFGDHTGLISVSRLAAGTLGWPSPWPAHLLPAAHSCPLPCWEGSSELGQTQPPFRKSLFWNRN